MGNCGSCKHHVYIAETDDWICTNDQSEFFAEYTDYENECEEWEEKAYGAGRKRNRK